jgi:hypothetical protein
MHRIEALVGENNYKIKFGTAVNAACKEIFPYAILGTRVTGSAALI